MAYDASYLSDVHELRELITRAAIALDTKRYDDWMDLCTDDVVLVFPMDPTNPMVIEGRKAFREQLNVLEAYEATTHFTGNMISDINGDAATTETYCIAHHIQLQDGERTNLRMSMRYRDSFTRRPEGWRMTRREMIIMWSELSPSPAL